MDKIPSFLYKTLVIGIIIIFIGICIVPGVNSILSNQTTLSNDQPDYSSFLRHPDEIKNNFINSFNLCTFEPQTNRYTYKTINYPIKLNDSNIVKKSPMPISNAKTLYVGGNGPGNYSIIQAAIDDANDGDTVFVYDDSSPYYERDIYLSKSINLIGENKETTIIDGKRKLKNEIAWGISITANEVTISGFTIQNFVNPPQYIPPGIWIFSSNNIITGNIITNNSHGIVLDGRSYSVNYNIVADNIINSNVECGVDILNSNNNIISMNNFSNNYYYGGLYLHTSSYNVVSDNVFCNDGVWIYNSYKNTFFNNILNDKPIVYLEAESDKIIEENAGQVILIECDNITVQNQDISNSSIGLFLDQTNNCLISNNKISTHPYSGIMLVHSNNNNISKNIISNENLGIFFYYSNGNTIFLNTIKSSSWFGTLIGYSDSNNILTNTFVDNNGGLSLDGSSYNDVSDNVFYNDGIFVYNAWKNIFQNNYVNDKSVVYLEDESDIIIDETTGQVFLINCDNITVQNQEISDAFVGISLINTDNCLISDNILSSNIRYGIFLTNSQDNNISSNTISDNPSGITLDTSPENMIFRNNIILNKNYGIWFSNSEYNKISYNNIKKNGGRKLVDNGLGVFLLSSSNNEIHYNNFLRNARDAYFFESSSNNWDFNYWNRPRLLPRIILGEVSSLFFSMRINLARHPALKPYDI